MNVEQLLANPLVETFVMDGSARSIQDAHDTAWTALNSAQRAGTTDYAWALKVMQFIYDDRDGSVMFHAEFVRKPDEVE